MTEKLYRQAEQKLWAYAGLDPAEHVPDVEVREIAGAGHLGPILAPEAVAEELAGFFTRVLQPA